DRLPFPPDEIAGLMLTMFALLPSALFVTWAANGRPGVIGLVKRIARWRFGIGWWLAVLAGLPVLTVIFTLILGGSLESIDPVTLFWDQLRLLLINFIWSTSGRKPPGPAWCKPGWSTDTTSSWRPRGPPCRSDSSTCRSPSSARSPS